MSSFFIPCDCMEEIYLGLLAGGLFFVVKLIMEKLKYDVKPNLLRDSFLVTVVIILLLYLKTEYMKSVDMKTPVFVNEPGF
jgi:hypothetical protein